MQALPFGEPPAGLRRALDLLPVGPFGGELAERGVELDLRGQIADLLGELQRLPVGLGGPVVVGLGDLEVVARG